MPTHIFQKSCTAGNSTLAGAIAVTNDTELNADLVLAASSSDVVLTLAFTVANCQSLCLYCTAAATVKTFEAATEKDTISLSAGIPVLCTSQAEVDALLTATAPTSLKLTCSAGGTFSFRAILSQNTP